MRGSTLLLLQWYKLGVHIRNIFSVLEVDLGSANPMLLPLAYTTRGLVAVVPEPFAEKT